MPSVVGCNAFSGGVWCPQWWGVMPLVVGCDALSGGVWCPQWWVWCHQWWGVMPSFVGCDALSGMVWCPQWWGVMPSVVGYNSLSGEMSSICIHVHLCYKPHTGPYPPCWSRRFQAPYLEVIHQLFLYPSLNPVLRFVSSWGHEFVVKTNYQIVILNQLFRPPLVPSWGTCPVIWY